MKSLLPLLLLLFVVSCSKEEPTPPPPTNYTVSITLNPTDGGTVSPKGGQFEEDQTVSFTVTPSENYIFKNWSGSDNSSNNPLSLTINTNKTLTVNFEKKDTDGDGVTDDIDQCPNTPDGEDVEESGCSITSITISNPIDTLVITKRHKFQVLGNTSNGDIIDISDLVKIIPGNEKITILDNNEITVGLPGTTYLKIQYKEFEILHEFESHEIEFVQMDNDFTISNSCNLIVPILILNLFPTKDGVLHDDSSGPSNYWEVQNPDLTKTKEKVRQDLILSKQIVEYGTRFRDYGKNQINPYICLEVVDYINVYSWNLVEWVNGRKTLDYNELFEKINLRNYVNNLGVKEVWITHFPKDEYPSIINSSYNDPNTFWSIPESNMSSPITGDISNSYRIQNDLPIYQNSYVVYGNSGHRGVDTNIHNRGHQIESQLRYIEKNKKPNEELFWNSFVGVNNGSSVRNSRSGNTHFPPNGESDYDYCQSSTIESDIKEWSPQGGKQEVVNCDTWTNINYDINMTVQNVNDQFNYDSDPHTKWLLFWFQSIPGEDNNISYLRENVEYKLTNWWDLFYNWDESIKTGKTLWE